MDGFHIHYLDRIGQHFRYSVRFLYEREKPPVRLSSMVRVFDVTYRVHRRPAGFLFNPYYALLDSLDITRGLHDLESAISSYAGIGFQWWRRAKEGGYFRERSSYCDLNGTVCISRRDLPVWSPEMFVLVLYPSLPENVEISSLSFYETGR